ncbi:MAG: DUF4143 domain-containing protein [Propionibacteriaceae bacterium]|jgi:predicted AAA+ superfamily ATPase|nr:DUF4143 domain-containing protein [Propionibacteriaceae bacterium]
MLTPAGYRPRIVDDQIKAALEVFGTVVLEGPKWCGKTWSALNQAESVLAVADPVNSFANRRLAELDPARALDGERPRAVDEWQEAPALWDAARHLVDQSNVKGQFIFTGSAKPVSGVIHSGAGRVGRLRMRTMSLLESGDSSGELSLESLSEGADPERLPGRMGVVEVAELVVRGGWPDALSFTAAQSRILAHSYLEAIANTDMTEVDGVRRDPVRTAALLTSLARNTATLVSDTTLRKDIAQHSPVDASPNTIRDYLKALTRLFVLESVPSWVPATRSRARVRVAPKRFLADSSLAAAALGLGPQQLVNDLNTLGFLFEALCLRDLYVYAGATGLTLHHYHDEHGLEADAVLVSPTGDWSAWEIKLGANQVDQAAQNLLALRKKLESAGESPPQTLAVVVGVGGIAERRSDGVLVLPVDRLGR